MNRAARRTRLCVFVLFGIFSLALLAGAARPAGLGPARIAFESNRDHNWNIYVMRSDGSGQRRLTTYPGDDLHPSWSPDRSKIVFERGAQMTTHALYTMNPNGTSVTRISPIGPWSRTDPEWSPVSQKIAYDFRTNKPQSSGIFTMSASGGPETQLVHMHAINPNWSPDGKRIVFEVRIDKYTAPAGLTPGTYLYVVNADGTGLKRLPKPAGLPAAMIEPSWSPDGTRIAFTCAADTCSGIYTMRLNGSGLMQVTKSGQSPCWSPDGKWIAAWANDPAKPFEQVFLYKADGTAETQLTSSSSDNVWPNWR